MGRKKGQELAERPGQTIVKRELIDLDIPGRSYSKQSFCPAKPSGDTEAEIRQWIEDVQLGGQQRGFHYTAKAIRYFARGFWLIYTKQIQGTNPVYKKVCLLINEVMGDE